LLIQDQDQDQDSAVSRSRPRLWCPRPRPRLKTQHFHSCNRLFHVLGKDNSQLEMSLRPREHSFNLPRYQYNLTRIFCFQEFILT